MTYKEIEEGVLSGRLRLEKTYMGKRTRRKYIWDEEGDHIKEVKTISYDKWNCMAMEKEHLGYKISKKVFEQLLKKTAQN
jgi:hypothetical protein